MRSDLFDSSSRTFTISLWIITRSLHSAVYRDVKLSLSSTCLRIEYRTAEMSSFSRYCVKFVIESVAHLINITIIHSISWWLICDVYDLGLSELTYTGSKWQPCNRVRQLPYVHDLPSQLTQSIRWYSCGKCIYFFILQNLKRYFEFYTIDYTFKSFATFKKKYRDISVLLIIKFYYFQDNAELVQAREVLGGRLTSDFVAERVGHSVFSEIRELDLPQLSLRSIDLGTGEAFVNLRSINLEHNNLTSLGGLIHLPNLRVCIHWYFC